MLQASFLSWALLLLGEPFTYEYSGTTDAKGTASVTIQANEDVDDLDIVISGDGQTIRKKVNLKAGGKQKLSWKQKSGTARYEMEIKGGSGLEASFAFDVLKAAAQGKVGQFKVKSSRDDIVERHTATYETPFALASYEYKIYDSDGDIVASEVVAPANVAAGGEFSVKWTSPVEIFMIEVRGEDEFGRFSEYKLVPWAVEIPHTEINFDSGKWDIKSDEVNKLDEALAVAFHELDALERVNKAVNANLTPQLYIVGYTDTVGPTPSNDKLSTSRAKAIAKYFHDKGFWAEIHFAGMGERALRVETGDNVDEIRNRRALYVIGVQPPPSGGQIPGHWQKLASARARPAGFTLPELPEQWKDYRDKRRAGENKTTEPGTPTDPNPATGDGDKPGLSGDGPGPATFPDDSGPPAVEGEPGATKKGCAIAAPVSSGPALGLLVLLAFARRRTLARGRGS